MKKSKISIDKKLLIGVMFSSSILTLIIVLLQLVVDYRSDYSNLKNSISQAMSQNEKSFSGAVWGYNEQQIKNLSDGMLTIKGVVSVKVFDNESRVLYAAVEEKYKDSEDLFVKTNQLEYFDGLNKSQIGSVEVKASKDYIYDSLIAKVYFLLLSQGLKTLIITIVLLFIFRILVTNKLNKISRYLTDTDFDVNKDIVPIRLSNSSTHEDELDDVEDKINEMVQLAHQNQKIMNKEIEAKTKKLQEQNDALANEIQRVKELQEKMIIQEKHAALGVLTAGVAHEIRNPLNILSSSAHIVSDNLERLKEFEVSAELKSELEDIEKMSQLTKNQIERIDEISSKMLDLARTSEEQAQEINLDEIIDNAYSMAFHSMRATNPFEVSCEKDIENTEAFCGKKNELERVFINIFENAFFSLSEKKKEDKSFRPKIKVRLDQDDDFTRISVEDNGVGIPEKIKRKIFDPFFTSKPGTMGNGLGLSLSFEIIKEHNGEIKVSSKEGQYACFEIAFAR
jgi:signal transduction histidine kinase